METVTYSDARAHFRETLDKVYDQHTPYIITRQNKPSVVMIALEDYNAMEETLHLMRTIANIKQGKYIKQNLIEA